MMLLAIPQDAAIVIKDMDASILQTKSDAVLNALRKIRKAESATAIPERLHELDLRIMAIETERQ